MNLKVQLATAQGEVDRVEAILVEAAAATKDRISPPPRGPNGRFRADMHVANDGRVRSWSTRRSRSDLVLPYIPYGSVDRGRCEANQSLGGGHVLGGDAGVVGRLRREAGG
ncbi:Hypothetical protein A7982_01200 [Minicystis rosea]|nr:Hypothetical protein A7982_01200 [Minicystis rosea]